MANKYNRNLYQNINTFHSDNLYVPKRIVYFGGNTLDAEQGPDEVNPYNASQLIKNLLLLDNMNKQTITLYLNTCGGDVEEGFAIYDFITSLKSNVNIIGIGKVYSMGSIILQAAHQRILSPNTLFMIHDGTEGYEGDSKSYEAWARVSKENRMTMYQIYYDRIRKAGKRMSFEEIETKCSHDAILTAKEAVTIGFADLILKSKDR
jgi:ATP-dependent Clp protease protease subunit